MRKSFQKKFFHKMDSTFGIGVKSPMQECSNYASKIVFLTARIASPNPLSHHSSMALSTTVADICIHSLFSYFTC